MNSWIDELRKVPIFSDCSQAELEVVAQHFSRATFPERTALINESSENSLFAILEEGYVDVVVGGRYRRTLGPGDFFGEISIQTGVLATASVLTRSAITALVTDGDQYRALLANPVLAHRLSRSVTERTLADFTRNQGSSHAPTGTTDPRPT
jgi:CRP/FNR family transcriptional regulator, cyclic AMP receptor protein